MLAGGAVFLSACGIMSQVQTTRHFIDRPLPDAWHAVLRGLIGTVLPFEHPLFPSVTVDDLLGDLQRLFRVDDDEDFAMLPRAVMLFDDSPLFEAPPALFVDDERRDLVQSRVPMVEIDGAIERRRQRDRASWVDYSGRHGPARFVDQSPPARRAYLSLWAGSEFITRRRFYRGVKALVTITAYSTDPFWKAVGYEGPLLGRG